MAPGLTEGQFMAQVTELAELCGWRWAHFRPARTEHGWRTPVSGPLGKGWPDLVLARARDRRLVFAELKVGAKLTPEQGAVLDALHDAGATAFIWRPEDWDTIVAVLR